MVSVESLAGLERRMQVSVPASRVRQQVDARLLKVSRTARIKGFRPGKAPIHVVRRHYGPQVEEEVVSDLIRETFAEAVQREKLAPAGGPRIEPVRGELSGDLRYTAVFEVYPQFQLGGIEALRLVRPQATVTESDVDAMIESLRQQRPDWVAAERGCQDSDRIAVDFEGRIDGELFDGGSGQGIEVVLGAGRLLRQFEDGVRGAAAGETREFELHFPEDYQNRTLAGRTAQFRATVHRVERPELPEVDDAFCALFGVAEGGIGKLRAEVRENMERELAGAIRARLKAQVMDQLVAANPMDLPRSLVEAEVRELQAEMLRRAGSRDARQLPPREAFEAPARRRVALALILNELVRNAGIQSDTARVQTRLAEIAAGYDDPEAARRQYLENEGAMRGLQMAVLEDQVVEHVIAAAQVADQPATFKDIMNFGAGAASEG